MSWAEHERSALADALLEAGPAAPTLCAGWTAHDLAAHLVARDRRPDSLPGIAVPALSRWTERVRQGFARREFADLVATFRAGSPWWSPFAVPRFEAAGNLVEYVVHAEDVRRARPGWEPRDLAAGQRDAIWRVLADRARMFYRRSPVGVVLAVPDGPSVEARPGEASVVLTGAPEELLLHAVGRGEHALVAITGPAGAVEALRATSLGV